jgi:hypothetical protein
MGRMPSKGSATLSAAKMENASSAWLSQRRGWTMAAYQGSTAVTSAPATMPARNSTFHESSVVLAQ